MTVSRRDRWALAAVLTVVVPACKSENPYRRPFELLTRSAQACDAGNWKAATSPAEELIGETNEKPEEFARQRFFAHHLLTLSHSNAACGEAFAAVASQGSRSRFATAEHPSQARLATPSAEVSHLMAALLNGWESVSLSDRAASMPAMIDGQSLAPPQLEKLGVDECAVSVRLCQLIVYGRLQSPDLVKEMLDSSPDLLDFERCRQIMEKAGTPERLRPWIYCIIHHHLRQSDERLSFKFAAHTLETAGQARGTITTSMIEEIQHWITDDSTFVFECPKCKATAIPKYNACLRDSTPLIQFDARKE